MRTYKLRIGLCLAGLTMCALALPMTAAAQPPAPDLGSMTLQPGDFPYGARLTQGQPGFREFDVGDRAAGRRVRGYASQFLEVEDSAEDARAVVGLQKRVFSTRQGRLGLAREIVTGMGRRSGVKAKDVRFAPMRSLRAGDGGFVLRFTIAARGQAIVITEGFMSVGPVDTIVTLGGRKHSRLPSRLVSLMRAAAGRIGAAQPAISGTAAGGQTLTASTGSWDASDQPAAFGYLWLRCNAAGGACAPIAGATGASYVVAPDDVGATLRVQVTASNADGSTDAVSAQTAPIG